jgi:hypothetical protein
VAIRRSRTHFGLAVVKIAPNATPADGPNKLDGMRMFTRGRLTGFMVVPLVAALIVVSGFWPVMGLSIPTSCGTASPPTCSKPGLTCTPSALSGL